MAFTRKMLKAMGIEEEKIDQIIEAHVEVVGSLKDERDEYKDKADKLQIVEKELKSLKADNEGISWKEKYDKVQQDFDAYKEKQKAETERQKTVNAYKEVLKKTGVSEKRIDSIIKISDLSNIKLDKDGNIKNEDSVVENIKTEWSDFIVQESTKGANVENPPKNTGGSKMTKDEIFKIKDASERQKKIAENIELFRS